MYFCRCVSGRIHDHDLARILCASKAKRTASPTSKIVTYHDSYHQINRRSHQRRRNHRIENSQRYRVPQKPPQPLPKPSP